MCSQLTNFCRSCALVSASHTHNTNDLVLFPCLQPGDIIVKVKNTLVRAGNLRGVSSRLAGPLGSKITMLCSRTRPSSHALEGSPTTLPQQHTISLVLTRDVQVHDPSVLDDALQDQEDEEEKEQVLVGWVVGSARHLGPLIGSKNEQLKKRGSSFASDPPGEYAGHEQVVSPPPMPQMWSLHVDRIEGFSDSAGLMDKTDPFVKIIVGVKNKQEFKTQVKENVGGIAAFDETFTFEQVSRQIQSHMTNLRRTYSHNLPIF